MKSKIELIDKRQDMSNIKEQVLKNRGIENVKEYLSLGTQNLHDYELLGKGHLEMFYLYLERAIEAKSKVFILVDTDCDGYCSGAMMYSYLTKDLGMTNVKYILNKDKIHGLTQEVVDYIKENAGEDCLLIIPDAGTNDSKFCYELYEDYHIHVVVIDHHEQDKENPNAIIINPKKYGCEYPNKNLCGAAVVYKVLCYLDEMFFEDYANQYLDLMGVAMVADIMDLRDLESRFLTTRGLMNIENKLLKAIITKNSFNISNTEYPNAIDVAFYISPYINSCIRIGTEEERELLFRAFIEDDQGETFPYTPRKSKNNPEPVEIQEDLYTHVARICSSTKSKQDRMCEKEAKETIEWLKTKRDNKLIVLNKTGFDERLMGVLANKVCNMIKKPVILMRKIDDDFYSGSARNFNNSYIYDLKKEVSQSGFVSDAGGHASAFGVKMPGSNVGKLVQWFEEKYKDIDCSKTFYVDYWLDGNVPFNLIREINEMKSLFSNFVEQPFIAANNIEVRAEDIQIITAENGNKRFVFVVDDIEYVKFKLPEDDELVGIYDDLFESDMIVFDVVGKTNINMFGGKTTPQFIIEDYSIRIEG